MKPLDKNYLMLQFRIKVYSKNGTEFQSFFESIMEKAFPDFQKIKPYGNKGDAGNDGYRKDSGIYYQVYAPNVPSIMLLEAAKKLKRDFEKLKNGWDEISKIKEYYFVFNDKGLGTTQKLEETISELEKNNPNIKFTLFLAKNLEDLFFKLDESDILNLDFNIDQRQAISNAYKYLESVKTELDRENVKLAKIILENIKDIISSFGDENLSLEYEILECRCLQKLEKVGEAKEKYENISKRYPNDPRAFLYLAEIYLNDKDFNKNKELIEKTEKIDNDYWLLKLEKLVRKNHLVEKIDTANIDEQEFPDEPRIRSNFYRLYALFFETSGDQTNADSFIEKAIYSNSDRLGNYIAKLSLIENRMILSQDVSQKLQKSKELLEEIKKVESRFFEYGDIGARNKAILNLIKLNALRIQENYPELERVSKEAFELSISCYFDKQIEQTLSGILQFVSLPEKDLNQLLEYIKNSKKEISDELVKVLIFQFNLRNILLTEGEKFFKEINNQKYLVFISDIENKNYEKVLELLKRDIPLAIIMANTLKDFTDLRKKIIENLPNDKDIQKEKLLLLLNYNEKEYDQALEILRNLDLSKLNYLECKLALEIATQKQAWDFEIIILERLLEKEEDENIVFNLKLQLFNANFNLKKYPEVIKIGEELLGKDFNKNILYKQNKEALLTRTIIACLERGKIDKNEYKNAKKLLNKYPLTEPTFEFRAGIETEIYLKNNQPNKALESVLEGIKIKKVLTPEEYANLYFVMSIQIGDQINLKLDSLNKVEENTFIKLKNKDRWYFIGNDNELDTIKITETNNKYSLFIDKKVGDRVVITNKYSSENSEEIIENIFSMEKYVLWQVIHNFQKLSKDNVLGSVQMVEVPEKEGTVDLKYLLEFLKDMYKGTEPFFEIYCKKNISLAVLAVSEGGLTNAIGRIQNENRGFINFSIGTTEGLENQKDIARKVINNKLAFYLDGTSALVLSESDLLRKVFTYLPNLKVSQSVINLLIDTTEKFKYTPGQVGYMGYAQGKITFSSVEQEKRNFIQANFNESVKLLELKPKNIKVISSANKVNCFSEQKVPAELCDACILAQKENIPILTEDFLYLKMNELETKKKAPEYFSSLMLLRVLYEQSKVSFDEYLNFFGYLSSYRFRFLSLSPDDIEKAVFGDGKIKTIRPQNIRKLNFSLTLSEEYGVPFQMSFSVITIFLLRVLTDNSIPPDIVRKIFIEIIESFPTKKDKKTLGRKFLSTCIQKINDRSKLILIPKSKIIQEKIDLLSQFTQIYDYILFDKKSFKG